MSEENPDPSGLSPSFANRSLKKRLWLVSRWYLLGGGLVISVLVVRLTIEGQRSLHRAKIAQESGNTHLAIQNHLETVRDYYPGAAHVRKALENLKKQAKDALARGDRNTARRAFEAVRSGLMGVRSFYQPHGAVLDMANEELAGLYALLEVEERPQNGEGSLKVAGETSSKDARRAYYLGVLTQASGPRNGPVFLVFLGLGMWIGAVILFYTKALDEALRVLPRPASFAGITFVLGVLLFLLGLRLA